MVVPKTRINVPILDGTSVVPLENQFAVVLFENMQGKRLFYSDFEQLNEHVESVLAIECGQRVLQRMGSSVRTLACDGDLAELIDGLLDSSANDMHVNTLIVENISAYYWELKCRPRERVQWYKRLNGAIMGLMEKLQCNVIVTGWDNAYEKGYNFQNARALGTELDSVTYIPLELLGSADHLLSHGRGWMRYTDGWWQALQR